MELPAQFPGPVTYYRNAQEGFCSSSQKAPSGGAPRPWGACRPFCRDTVPLPGPQPGSRGASLPDVLVSITLSRIERKCYYFFFFPFLGISIF